MPIYTQCIRPYKYDDTSLFIPRQEEEEEKKVQQILAASLDSTDKGCRLLVTGERGIGKSIGVRAAVQRLEEEKKNCFSIIVTGAECTTVRHLIITVAECLLRRVRELFPNDKDLLKEVSHLPDILRPEQTTRGELYRRGRDVESHIATDFGLLGFIKTKLGIRGSLSQEHAIEASASIPIDDHFRIQFLVEILRSIAHQERRYPLLVVDNLDQIAEKERIEEFMRYLLVLRDFPLVITIRNEFVCADILREHRFTLMFKPLSSETLMKILERRLEVDCQDAQRLRQAGLLDIARKLSTVTGNPMAFLFWIEYLCWNTQLRAESCFQDLKGFVEAYYGTKVEEVLKTSCLFYEKKQDLVSRAILKKELKLDDYDIDTLEQNGVLVPNDITRPAETRRYTLSPLLSFLKLLK